MQVILHVGAPCTDEDRLIKCLLRNADDWRPEGISVPEPDRYRRILSQTLTHMGQSAPATDARDVLLDSILVDDTGAIPVERMVLSHPTLLSPARMVFEGGVIFRHAEERMRRLRRLFPNDDLELFFALRDPASFVPALYASAPQTSPSELLRGFDPMRFRWSELLMRLRTALPEVPITAWCYEDTPLTWAEVLRRHAGIALERKITGAFDVLADIIEREGMRRFRGFLRENPTINEAQKRRVMTAILGKYARDDALEDVIDMPGWGQEHLDYLSAQYDRDLDVIARVPGVHLVTA